MCTMRRFRHPHQSRRIAPRTNVPGLLPEMPGPSAVVEVHRPYAGISPGREPSNAAICTDSGSANTTPSSRLWNVGSSVGIVGIGTPTTAARLATSSFEQLFPVPAFGQRLDELRFFRNIRVYQVLSVCPRSSFHQPSSLLAARSSSNTTAIYHIIHMSPHLFQPAADAFSRHRGIVDHHHVGTAPQCALGILEGTGGKKPHHATSLAPGAPLPTAVPRRIASCRRRRGPP